MVRDIASALANSSLPKFEIERSDQETNIKSPELPMSVIIASILINMLGLAMPLTILQVYDRILPNQSVDTLIVLILGLAVVLFLDAVLKIARAYIVGWHGASFTHNAQLEAIRRVLYARSDLLNSISITGQMDRLRALQSIGDYYGGQSRLLSIDLPASIIFLLVLFLIGGPVGFVPLALLAVFAIKTYLRNQRMHDLVSKRGTQDQRKYDFIMEVLTGMTTIKALGLEPLILRRFERLQKQTAQQGYDYIQLANEGQNAATMFTTLTTVFVVVTGALLAINDYISIGAVAACTLLAGQVVTPMLRGINHWTDMQRIQHDFDEVRELFALPTASAPTTSRMAIAGNIDVRGISFTFNESRHSELNNLSIRIHAGETVAFDGADGSGRSTLMRVLSGDLKPTTGAVQIDGQDLFGSSHRGLKEQIAYVGADAQVFSGTILQNLTLFGSQSDPKRARLAADLIGLEKDIHLLPLGYDTVLGAGIDENLTASLIQRIAIARALASEPKILILDDANGVLDHRSESELSEALARLRGHLTLLIVSHRPSFRAIADREVVLDEGAVVEIKDNHQDEETQE